MQHILKLLMVASVAAMLAACGASSKEEKGSLNDKKTELQKLKNDQAKLEERVQQLEADIAKTDPLAVAKPKLVGVTNLASKDFLHYIDLQGRISTENLYYVAPRGQGGQVKAIYVKEGDQVRSGQLVLKLDDAVMLQQLEQLKTQLAYAKDLYNRRKNLWDQGIGTEVEFINARNAVDNLERQIATLKETWSTSNVYSHVSGVVDQVNIRVGEMFTGNPQASVTIINGGNLKAVVDVPENYLSKVKKGMPVVVSVPDINKDFNSRISLVSQQINNTSRAFTAEAKLSPNSALKPNLLATVKIQDYMAKNVIVIPLTSIQTDDKGKFVYVMVKENGKSVSRRKPVAVGEVYGNEIEIKQGLTEGDQLITQGFESIYDGQVVTTDSNT